MSKKNLDRNATPDASANPQTHDAVSVETHLEAAEPDPAGAPAEVEAAEQTVEQSSSDHRSSEQTETVESVASAEETEQPAPEGFVLRDGSELTTEQLAEIDAHAVTAVKRRAPKIGAFFFVGAVVGIILGLWFGLGTSHPNMINRSVYVMVYVAFTTAIISLIAGFIAVALDKVSARRADEQKKVIG